MPSLFALFILFLNPQTVSTENGEWERIRSMAEAQHEIVMLLIKNKEFDKVLKASRKIFSLKFPPQQDHLLAREGQILADALAHEKQYELAHQLLDEAIKAAVSPKSKASLYKEKAYLCRQEDKDEEAMDLFEKALEWEQSVPK